MWRYFFIFHVELVYIIIIILIALLADNLLIILRHIFTLYSSGFLFAFSLVPLECRGIYG